MIGYAQLATYICFRLFEVDWYSEFQPNEGHPLPAVRLYWIARIALHLSGAFARLGVSQERFYARNVEMIRVAEEGCAKLVGREPNYSMLASVNNTAQYEAYYIELNNEWCRIRPTLASFNRPGRLRACAPWAPVNG
jgi:hypothetical protein